MFPVDFGWLIFIYLGSFIVVVTLAWLYFDRPRETSFVAGERHIWECPVCGLTYVNSKRKDFVSCTRCGAINARDDLDNPELYK